MLVLLVSFSTISFAMEPKKGEGEFSSEPFVFNFDDAVPSESFQSEVFSFEGPAPTQVETQEADAKEASIDPLAGMSIPDFSEEQEFVALPDDGVDLFLAEEVKSIAEKHLQEETQEADTKEASIDSLAGMSIPDFSEEQEFVALPDDGVDLFLAEEVESIVEKHLQEEATSFQEPFSERDVDQSEKGIQSESTQSDDNNWIFRFSEDGPVQSADSLQGFGDSVAVFCRQEGSSEDNSFWSSDSSLQDLTDSRSVTWGDSSFPVGVGFSKPEKLFASKKSIFGIDGEMQKINRQQVVEFCKKGDYDNLLCLVESAGNVSVNFIDKKTGQTPLIIACRMGKNDIVNYLLTSKANIRISDKSLSKRYFIHHACDVGNIEAIKVALEHGVDINKKDAFGNTPLHIACIRNNLPVVRLLISQGADLFQENISDQSPEDLAKLDEIKHFIYESKAVFSGVLGTISSYDSSPESVDYGQIRVLKDRVFQEHVPCMLKRKFAKVAKRVRMMHEVAAGMYYNGDEKKAKRLYGDALHAAAYLMRFIP